MRTGAVSRGLTIIAALWIPTPLRAQFNAPAAKLTETLRISGADEDLSRVGSVFVSPDGRIAFTQP